MNESQLKEFSKICYHGKNVYNPYTGNYMYQPCGKCEACLTRKASSRSMRVSLQASISKYTFFVTLTYNTKFVPKAKIYKVHPDNPEDDLYVMRTIPRRKEDFINPKIGRPYPVAYDDDSFSYFNATDKYVKEFCAKGNLGVSTRDENRVIYPELKDTYGYICWKDFQLFYKRMRYYFSKKIGKYEKIHTYIVSEYTPKRFRPHFHFILCTDSDEIAKVFGQVLRACWTFGLVDWSRSRGAAESYVAGYVNSLSRIPYHLGESNCFKPRGRFSNGFAASYFVDACQAVASSVSGPVSEVPYSPFLNGIPSVINGRLVAIKPLRSCVDSCFLRHAANNRLSSHELSRIVRAYTRQREAYKDYCRREGRKFTVMSFACFLLNSILHQTPISLKKFLDIECDVGVLYYYSRLESPSSHMRSDVLIKRDKLRLYQLFMAYERFVNFWHISKDTSYHSLVHILDISRHYYATLSYMALTKALNFLSYIDEMDDDLYNFFMHPVTDDNPDKLVYNPSFGKLVSTHGFLLNAQNLAKNRCTKAIKHREINDLNIKFLRHDNC